jgi:hypothetical protein
MGSSVPGLLLPGNPLDAQAAGSLGSQGSTAGMGGGGETRPPLPRPCGPAQAEASPVRESPLEPGPGKRNLGIEAVGPAARGRICAPSGRPASPLALKHWDQGPWVPAGGGGHRPPRPSLLIVGRLDHFPSRALYRLSLPLIGVRLALPAPPSHPLAGRRGAARAGTGSRPGPGEAVATDRFTGPPPPPAPFQPSRDPPPPPQVHPGVACTSPLSSFPGPRTPPIHASYPAPGPSILSVPLTSSPVSLGSPPNPAQGGGRHAATGAWTPAPSAAPGAAAPAAAAARARPEPHGAGREPGRGELGSAGSLDPLLDLEEGGGPDSNVQRVTEDGV